MLTPVVARSRDSMVSCGMLTKKAKYGLKAMAYLAGVEPGQTALVADIAASNQIPKKFLDAILSELRNAGFVHSKKGKGGGYMLARLPTEINVGDLVRTLDGPLAPIQCASRRLYRKCEDCVDETHCAVRLVMIEARDAIARVLDHTTLSQMRALGEAGVAVIDGKRPKKKAGSTAMDMA